MFDFEKKSLKIFIEDLFKTFFTVLLLAVLTALFIFICIPVYMYRLLIYVTSRLLRPDLDRMLSPQSSLMAIDTIYTEPKCSLVAKFVLNGEISQTKLETRLKTAVSLERHNELSQTLVSWLGFFFWKKPSKKYKFCVETQIKFVGDTVSQEEINDYHTSLVYKPFKKFKPLWDCVVYSNVQPEKVTKRCPKQSVIFFRVHQALADGKSFLGIFEELKMISEHQGTINAMMDDSKDKTLMEKIKFAIKVFLLGPYQLTKDIVDSKFTSFMNCIPELRKLKQNRLGRQGSDKELLSIENVRLEDIKKISMSQMAPTAALVFALISGAIRRVYSDRGIRIPNQFKINCPMPLPRETDRLSNFVTYIPVDAPLTVAEPVARLGFILNYLGNLLYSTTPYVVYGLVTIVGGLTKGLIHFCSGKLPLGPVLMNNYLGPNYRKKFLDVEVSEISVKSGCTSLLGGAWCTFNSVNYGGEVFLSVTCPKELDMSGKVLKELEAFQTKSSNRMFGMSFGGLMKDKDTD